MAKQTKPGRDERFSALWGTTKRDGETRGSALWGNGGRGGAVMLALLTALMMIPLAAGAVQSSNSGSGSSSSGSSGSSGSTDTKLAIPSDLLAQAQANPGGTFRVIVQGAANQGADKVASDVAKISAQTDPKLADAANKADDAARTLDDYKRLSDDAVRKQADADKAATDAAAKAATAARTGKKSDRDAAKKAADDAARKAADAAQAAQAAAKAKAAAGIADDTADNAHGDIDDAANTVLNQQITDEFDSISGVAAGLTGQQIASLATHSSNLEAITPDVPVYPMGAPAPPADPGKWSSTQAWVHAIEADGAWGKVKDPQGQANTPAIAIVDSGVDNRADFGNRLVASVNLSTLPNNSPGDGRGHGTFVASIAAGSADKSSGVAPGAKIVSIDVLDDNGMGMTSDVIRAAQWILDNKAKYNIRVANFSLNSEIVAPFYVDPLDQAVEQLWFNGVVVVTAAGNSGTGSTTPSGVSYSPANDPFVITVGAADIGTKADTKDDTMAPWSSWGSTGDGFSKPELSAPGRYMIGAVSNGATLQSERPDAVRPGGYMQLSGTSFAAPVVSGAAAEIIAKHPNFTPDQVKGALMLTAKPLDRSVGLAGGVGEVSVNKALDQNNPPNPNLALTAFVGNAQGQTGVVFNAASWNRAAQSNASWNSASWNSASWNSASWNSASWNSASWNSASWNSASWNSASWNSASWNSASWNRASWNSASWHNVSLEDMLDRDDN